MTPKMAAARLATIVNGPATAVESPAPVEEWPVAVLVLWPVEVPPSPGRVAVLTAEVVVGATAVPVVQVKYHPFSNMSGICLETTDMDDLQRRLGRDRSTDTQISKHKEI